MLWEIQSKLDFFSELQKKMSLENLKKYRIIVSNARLVDQEDFYGALLEHLRDNHGTGVPMVVEIREVW